jgi:hypothetical protein
MGDVQLTPAAGPGAQLAVSHQVRPDKSIPVTGEKFPVPSNIVVAKFSKEKPITVCCWTKAATRSISLKRGSNEGLWYWHCSHVRSSAKSRKGERSMSSKTIFGAALVVASLLLANAGYAEQIPPVHNGPWPIRNGRNHQPTENELRSLHLRDVTPDQAREIDRLYSELLTAHPATKK